MLHLNHVDTKKKHDPGAKEFLKILKGIPTIDVLDLRCANCNTLYEFERGRRSYPPQEQVIEFAARLDLDSSRNTLSVGQLGKGQAPPS